MSEENAKNVEITENPMKTVSVISGIFFGMAIIGVFSGLWIGGVTGYPKTSILITLGLAILLSWFVVLYRYVFKQNKK